MKLQLRSAVVLLILLSSFVISLSGQETSSGAISCTVSGRVLNQSTGAPLKAATIQLREVEDISLGLETAEATANPASRKTRKMDHSVESLADGSFCFHSIDAGSYFLSATKMGFLDCRYGAKTYLESASTITVSENHVKNVTLFMRPSLGIAGKVTDTEGEPVLDVSVFALRQTWTHGVPRFTPVQTVTNERGEYRLGNLRPGKYFVYVDPRFLELSRPPGQGLVQAKVRTYYPNASALKDSTPIFITDDSNNLEGIDVRVVRSNMYHVSGKVYGPQSSWLTGGALRLSLSGEESDLNAYANASLSPDGSFDLPGIAPGSYVLSFRSAQGGGSTAFEVSTSDVVIKLPVSGNGAIQGTFVVEGRRDIGVSTAPQFGLTLAEVFGGLHYSADVDTHGKFKVSEIPPGLYFVNISAPAGLFARSISALGSALIDGELDMTAGGLTTMEIDLRYGTAIVSGNVVSQSSASDSSLADGEHMLDRQQIGLIPFPIRGGLLGIYFSATDRNGHFSIRNIAPGSYYAVAFHSLASEVLENVNFLNAINNLGVKVDLDENSNANVSIEPIANDVIARLISQ